MNDVNCYITGNLALAEKAPDYFERALRVYHGLTPTEARIVRVVAGAGGFIRAADMAEPLEWPAAMADACWRAMATHRSNLRYRYGIDLRVVRRSPVPALAFDWYDCWGPVQGPKRPAHVTPRYGRGSPICPEMLALDAYRRRHSLTTYRLADRLRVQRGTLSQWLHGHARPGPDAKLRIRHLLLEDAWTRAK